MADWFEKITLGSMPDRAAKKFGDKEALCFKGKRWDFAQLAEDIDRASKGLMRLGIQPGDKVCLWVPNRPEFIHIFFGLARIGAIIVPINTFLRTADTAYLLKQSNSTTLITVDKSGPVDYRSMVYDMLSSDWTIKQKEISHPEFPDLKRIVILSDNDHDGIISWLSVLEQGQAISNETLKQRSKAVNPDDTVLIMYTSGTTGFPKGAMHSHCVIRNITDQVNRLAVTHEDVILMYLPLFHVFGLYEGPLMSMISGARMIITERFDAAECLSLIEKEGATMIHGFDTHFKDLVEHQEKSPRDVGSLRSGLFATGMSSSAVIAHRVHKVLCPGLSSAFGMSEVGVGSCVSFPTSTEEQRCEASGFPLPGYEIKIMNPETGREQPTGTPGEILVRSYMVMKGYYNKPEETAKAVDEDGWMHTGDMGVMRPDGHLRFMGRFKEMLKTGGENVDPVEVEAYLLGHPCIQQAAIVGYPDERLSEVGVAFVKLKPGKNLSQEDIIGYCRGKIATFKIPRHVIFIDDYPMTASGKIQKVKLKEMALKIL